MQLQIEIGRLARDRDDQKDGPFITIPDVRFAGRRDEWGANGEELADEGSSLTSSSRPNKAASGSISVSHLQQLRRH